MELIRTHLDITNVQQSESADDDEWQHLCCPCDLYFANGSELSKVGIFISYPLHVMVSNVNVLGFYSIERIAARLSCT